MKIQVAIICFLFVMTPLYVVADTTPTAPKILAEKTEMTEDGLKAEGHVEVSWEQYKIYADSVEYIQSKREIVARGRVTMASEETVISGEELRFNLKENKGELYEIEGMMMPSIRFKTDKLNQVDKDTLKFDKLNFTSCTQLVPRWSISCSKGKIKKKKYIQMSHALFKVKKIPIFYVPYMRYPIDEDGRSTGFLFPRMGNSILGKFFIANSFFWEIRPNLDLTVNFDYYDGAGLGLGGQFRYLFKNISGDIDYYNFRYFDDSEYRQASRKEVNYDYILTAEHIQTMNFLNTRIVVNVDRQSDPSFLRLFDRNFDRMLMNNYRSSVSLTSSVDNVTFSVRAARYETYYTFDNSSRVREMMPSITLNLNQQKIWKLPGYFSLSTKYEDALRTGKIFDYEDPEIRTGVNSQSIEIEPSYTLPLLTLPWLSTTVSFTAHEKIFAKSIDPETNEVVNEPFDMFNYSTTTNIKGPIFYKIYESEKRRTKHLIEPEIEFRYVSPISEEDEARIVKVDRSDYPLWSYVGFGLSMSLLTKERDDSKAAREILRYTVRQQYYLDPEYANYQRVINGEHPEFSELQNTLRFRPSKSLSLDVSANYNYYIEDFSRLNFRLAYRNKDSYFNGSLSYSSYVNPFARADYQLNQDVIRSDFKFEVPNFPIKLQGGVDYDLTRKQFRYGAAILTYKYQCVNFKLNYRIYTYLNNKVESQISFQVSLGNLGMVSDMMNSDR
jgi:lipopolysaccharide assembly outer membrane protein LptD (OstA)